VSFATALFSHQLTANRHHPRSHSQLITLAMDRFAETFRSLWHAVTTNDRHATYDSPYRTGSHVSLPQSRHAPMTSVATSALDSRVSLPTSTDPIPPSSIRDSKSPSINGRAMSPSSSYAPGMRSAQRQVTSLDRERGDSLDKMPSTEIQLQSFNDGLPPPPPVSHSWKRIERWLEDNYNELFENLCEPATHNDINELEHELNCTLPQEIRESLQIHDGQERGGRPTGIIFGCMLLDCEEIVEEWSNWRAVHEQYMIDGTIPSTPQIPLAAIAGPSSPNISNIPLAESSKPNWKGREDLLGKQDSQPPNAIQKAYAHTAWIPLARDWGGNCLAVDLEPGPMGRYGQIIIFGRDYDCKFVVARSWAAFLASLADDLTSGSDKVTVDEESNDLKFKPFKRQGIEPPYLEVLRWRCDQKHGRRPPRKRLSAPGSPGLRINPNVQSPHFENTMSPYASPGGLAPPDRGRSPQRTNGKAPIANSPMRAHVSSPLARVAEEGSAPKPLSVRTDSDTLKGGPPARRNDKLISVDTPRASGDFPIARLGASASPLKENLEPTKRLVPVASSNGIVLSAPSLPAPTNPEVAILEPTATTTTVAFEPSTTAGAEVELHDVPVDEFKTVAI
jgi:cell wall assembly regulator SMI1